MARRPEPEPTSIIDRDAASCGECGGPLAVLGTPASGCRTEQRMTTVCLDCGSMWLFVLRLVRLDDMPRRRPAHASRGVSRSDAIVGS